MTEQDRLLYLLRLSDMLESSKKLATDLANLNAADLANLKEAVAEAMQQPACDGWKFWPPASD